ncbi:MAG: hypothetical protein NUW37_04365 [Planctomycetes bacterium]|nr:hypothetical protein [Planctomycetota bacterium]
MKPFFVLIILSLAIPACTTIDVEKLEVTPEDKEVFDPYLFEVVLSAQGSRRRIALIEVETHDTSNNLFVDTVLDKGVEMFRRVSALEVYNDREQLISSISQRAGETHSQEDLIGIGEDLDLDFVAFIAIESASLGHPKSEEFYNSLLSKYETRWSQTFKMELRVDVYGASDRSRILTAKSGEKTETIYSANMLALDQESGIDEVLQKCIDDLSKEVEFRFSEKDYVSELRGNRLVARIEWGEGYVKIGDIVNVYELIGRTDRLTGIQSYSRHYIGRIEVIKVEKSYCFAKVTDNDIRNKIRRGHLVELAERPDGFWSSIRHALFPG